MPGLHFKGHFTVPKNGNPDLIDDTIKTYITKIQNAEWIYTKDTRKESAGYRRMNIVYSDGFQPSVCESFDCVRSRIEPKWTSNDISVIFRPDGYVEIYSNEEFQSWCLFKLPTQLLEKIDKNVFKQKRSKCDFEGPLDEFDIRKYTRNEFNDIIHGGFCNATSSIGDCIIGYTEDKDKNELMFTLPGILMTGTFKLPVKVTPYTTNVDGEWESFPYTKTFELKYVCDRPHQRITFNDVCDLSKNITVTMNTEGDVTLESHDTFKCWCKFTHPFYTKDTRCKRRKKC
jgi:hypothetical protein